MATTINSVAESMISTVNRNMTQQNTEQTNEQPEQNTEAVETQVERTDTVEITSNRNTEVEAPPPEPIESPEAAMDRVQEVKEMVQAEEAAQAEQTHDMDPGKLVDLLA